MDKSALILGIAGQNGRLLTELLLSKNYRVVGFGWKDSIEQSATLRPFRDRIAVCYGDLREPDSLAAALQAHPVSEIYNFAAQSQPGLSWQTAVETGEVNALGAHRLFEAVRRLLPQARIFQASSSEMFGAAAETPQRETTPFQPINPYAVSKTYAHQTAAIYRQNHGSYIACGILYNHESRYRDMAFLSQKVTYGAVCAKLGVRNSPLKNEQGEPMVKDGKLALGNLDATRDWGYAGDYVQAMWLMLQQPQADDFVIGTGREPQRARDVRGGLCVGRSRLARACRRPIRGWSGRPKPGPPSPTPARPSGCSAGSPPPASRTCWPTWWRRIWSGFRRS